MLGVGFGVFREMMDRGFRTRDQVRSILNTECLALIPMLPKSALRKVEQTRLPPVMLPLRTSKSIFTD